MSSFSNNISDAERLSHAVALLGGTTAQAYRSVSLDPLPHSAFESDLESTDLPEGSSEQRDFGLLNAEQLSINKTVQEMPAGSLGASMGTALSLDDFQSLPLSGMVAVDEDPELLSRFSEASVNSESLSVANQTLPFSAREGDSVADPAASSGGLFSLLDLIEQAIAQAQASQSEFAANFDGSRQGAVREILVNVGIEVGSGIRDFFQNNVEGAGRESVAALVDSTGVELLDPVLDPLLAVDYYQQTADVLNGILDSVAQPIGTVALPQLGPLLADPREELTAYLLG